MTFIISLRKVYKKNKIAKQYPDLIAKTKGGVCKSGQLLTVILITKILDLPLFFFSTRFFRPHLMRKVGKWVFSLSMGVTFDLPPFCFGSYIYIELRCCVFFFVAALFHFGYLEKKFCASTKTVLLEAFLLEYREK